MTRMTGPDCAVMCNLISIHTYTHTYIYVLTVLFTTIVYSIMEEIVMVSLSPSHRDLPVFYRNESDHLKTAGRTVYFNLFAESAQYTHIVKNTLGRDSDNSQLLHYFLSLVTELFDPVVREILSIIITRR